MNRIFRQTDMRSVKMGVGITRKMVSCGDQCQMIQFDLKKGARIPEHSHPHEQIGYLVKGRFLIMIEEEEFELSEGEGYVVESGTKHSVNVLEDSTAIDIFAPPREDYR